MIEPPTRDECDALIALLTFPLARDSDRLAQAVRDAAKMLIRYRDAAHIPRLATEKMIVAGENAIDRCSMIWEAMWDAAPKEPAHRAIEPGTNTGHGHVWPRPDGYKARCGGPGLCAQCSRDKAMYDAAPPASADAPIEAEPRSMDYGNWMEPPEDSVSADAPIAEETDEVPPGYWERLTQHLANPPAAALPDVLQEPDIDDQPRILRVRAMMCRKQSVGIADAFDSAAARIEALAAQVADFHIAYRMDCDKISKAAIIRAESAEADARRLRARCVVTHERTAECVICGESWDLSRDPLHSLDCPMAERKGA